ncbi:MAG: ATPase, T2SS/T4P/T4SS family [Clostridiales bacterium]|nr:ATPase, T2SS/T4P/T4SS family [Clostridiales bacterium]
MAIEFMNRTIRQKRRLGDILLAAGVITEEQLKLGLENQKQKKLKLGEALVDLKILNEDQIVEALVKQLGVNSVNLLDMQIPESIIKLVDEQVLRKYTVFPFELNPRNASMLRVAMVDPLDIIAMDDLGIITNYEIEQFVASKKDILTMINRYYGNSEAKKAAERYSKERKEQQGADKKEDEKENELDVSNSPIVQLVNKVIEQAARQRASDIHIEPMEKQVRIRYRIDGVLTNVMTYGLDVLTAIIARIKIIGGMDISEKRKPQDGRITSVVDGTEYDIRVSILPTVFGEKVVMRLTSKMALTKDKKDLGFSDDEMEKFDRILKNPHGIILVTGPTGSGKSTTLYTALSELNVEGVNIITVEDPVEANIDGINQVQVNVKADMTFAAALRSILRQDPDIIMIGEIRDRETAEIAVKASITGHLVVSTLHTNSAASTITRLADMGVEPYLIADATVGVIAQRLVRRLCPKCKKERYADAFECKLMECSAGQDPVIYDPVGCMHCNHTGYRGRIGVYEIMPITPKLREVISNHGNAEQIKEIALQEGMKTLRKAAAKYVLDGTTSISELRRIAFEE